MHTAILSRLWSLRRSLDLMACNSRGMRTNGRCSVVSLFRCSVVPLFRCSGVLAFALPVLSLLRCFATPLLRRLTCRDGDGNASSCPRRCSEMRIVLVSSLAVHRLALMVMEQTTSGQSGDDQERQRRRAQRRRQQSLVIDRDGSTDRTMSGGSETSSTKKARDAVLFLLNSMIDAGLRGRGRSSTNN